MIDRVKEQVRRFRAATKRSTDTILRDIHARIDELEQHVQGQLSAACDLRGRAHVLIEEAKEVEGDAFRATRVVNKLKDILA